MTKIPLLMYDFGCMQAKSKAKRQQNKQKIIELERRKLKNRTAFREYTCWLNKTNVFTYHLAGVDLHFSVTEQSFVAAVATAALNASSKGWFH